MYIIDSGAALHSTGLASQTNRGKKTIRSSSNALHIQTATGTVVSITQPNVNVRNLGVFMVSLVENSPSVQSLERQCGEFGYSCSSNVAPRSSFRWWQLRSIVWFHLQVYQPRVTWRGGRDRSKHCLTCHRRSEWRWDPSTFSAATNCSRVEDSTRSSSATGNCDRGARYRTIAEEKKERRGALAKGVLWQKRPRVRMSSVPKRDGNTTCSRIIRRNPMVKSARWQTLHKPDVKERPLNVWMGLNLRHSFVTWSRQIIKCCTWQTSQGVDTRSL